MTDVRGADRPLKRKVSLSLDADLVAELERDGMLSAQVNEALAAEVARRRRRSALAALVEELHATYGPMDTPEDVEAISRFEDLLR